MILARVNVTARLGGPCARTSGGRIYRSTGKTLGNRHPLRRRVADYRQVCVSQVAALRYHVTELDGGPGDEISFTRLVPLPERTRRRVQPHVGWIARYVHSSVGERPAECSHADDRDILDAIGVGARHVQEIVNVLAVCPGLHLSGSREHPCAHIGAKPWDTQTGVDAFQQIAQFLQVRAPLLA